MASVGQSPHHSAYQCKKSHQQTCRQQSTGISRWHLDRYPVQVVVASADFSRAKWSPEIPCPPHQWRPRLFAHLKLPNQRLRYPTFTSISVVESMVATGALGRRTRFPPPIKREWCRKWAPPHCRCCPHSPGCFELFHGRLIILHPHFQLVQRRVHTGLGIFQGQLCAVQLAWEAAPYQRAPEYQRHSFLPGQLVERAGKTVPRSSFWHCHSS